MECGTCVPLGSILGQLLSIIYINDISEYNVNHLQKLQNSASHSILVREQDSSVAEMHQDLSILTLANIKQLHEVDCHKSYGQGSYCMSRFFTSVANVCKRRTRATSSKEVIVPRVKTTSGGKAYRCRGPPFWNTLQDSLRSIENPVEFKRSIAATLSQASIFGNQNFST